MQLSECLLTPGAEHTTDLVGNIRRKQELLDAGDPAHENIRTALIIGGGAMRGVFSGGVVTGLEELGLTEMFDNTVGVSVGASSIAYFLSGQARLGTTLFYEELTSKEFIDLTRLPAGNALNVNYLKDIFTGKKALDQEAIRNNRSHFYIGVTDMRRAQPSYIEAGHDEDKDLIKLIQASSSVPGLAPPIVIDNVLYGDGIIACKNPIGFAIETLGSTDILCVVNQPLRSDTVSISDRFLSLLLTSSCSPAIQRAYCNRHTMSDETAETDYSADVRIGIICPEEEPIGRLSQDAARLLQSAQQARQQTKALFE